MAGAGKLAVGSGTAFALGAVAGVVGNNLAKGPWFWVGFAALTLVGAGVSAWLTYRGATGGTAAVNHAGDNHIDRVTGHGGGPTVGVNYGQAHGGPGKGAS